MEPDDIKRDTQLKGSGGAGGSEAPVTLDDDLTRLEPMSTPIPGDSHSTGTQAAGPSGAVEQVGRYRIIERIGQGAMAVVYKAYDPSINRTLAIKFLHPQLCIDEEYRRRFLREARAAGNLSHPNIVTVFDVGESDGRPYIAMELLDGEPLNEVMDRQKGLPIREVLEIGIQLARALDYAHSKGVVHRDIKPSNIVFLKGGRQVKVTDFGIAHVESHDATQHTKMGTVLGTPQYMSPEQVLGQSVDGRSDLFSVGVVLYQLVTGQKPFEGDSLMTLMHQIIKDEPKPLENLRADVPPELRRIIKRCLSKQADKRFATGGELADALIKMLREMTIEAEQKGRASIIPLRVRWTLIMGIVVALTMGITGAIVNQREQAALMGQVMDYGASLGKFMATQSAVPTLTEDWVEIEVFVEEVMRTQNFHGIDIVDHQGIVRVSSDPAMVGQPYRNPLVHVIAASHAGVAVHSYTTVAGKKVIDFQAPITFQSKLIGWVHLDILEEPMARVARLSLVLMSLLVLVTVAAVSAATYFMADKYSKPIRLLRDAMAEIGKGRLEYRIAEKRKDEFGELYEAFDSMAQTLQERAEQQESTPGSDGESAYQSAINP